MDINWFPEKFANNALDKLTILFSKLFPYVGVEKQALENYIASVEKVICQQMKNFLPL